MTVIKWPFLSIYSQVSRENSNLWLFISIFWLLSQNIHLLIPKFWLHPKVLTLNLITLTVKLKFYYHISKILGFDADFWLESLTNLTPISNYWLKILILCSLLFLFITKLWLIILLWLLVSNCWLLPPIILTFKHKNLKFISKLISKVTFSQKLNNPQILTFH